LLGALKAGAQQSQDEDYPGEYLGAADHSTASPPPRDGEFAHVSSGENTNAASSHASAMKITTSTAAASDLFSRTSSCVYDKAKARERGRSYLGPRLATLVSDDSCAHIAVIKSLQREPEPPACGAAPMRLRRGSCISDSSGSVSARTGVQAAAVQVATGDKSPVKRVPTGHHSQVQSPVNTTCESPHSKRVGPEVLAPWSLRPATHQDSRRQVSASHGSDTFARATSISKDALVRASGQVVMPRELEVNGLIRKVSGVCKLDQEAAQDEAPWSASSHARPPPLLRPSSRSRVTRRLSTQSPLIASSSLPQGGAQSPVLDSPTRHARARAAACSSLAVRSLNDCPFFEGMLKVETHGEQRVRQLLYRQAMWLPAYCVLKDGVLSCSKDKRHTIVVDAFDMSETRVLVSDSNAKVIEFFVSTASNEALVEFLAKTEAEAATWVKLCGIARKWAENHKRVKMGLMPLSDAANRIVGARKIIKRWLKRLSMEAFDRWVLLLDSKAAKTLLPHLFKRTQSASAAGEKGRRDLPSPSLPVKTSKRGGTERSRTPDNKSRASASFIPGQARQVRVVNGRMTVDKAMPRAQLDKKLADAKAILEEEQRLRAAQVQEARAQENAFVRLPSHGVSPLSSCCCSSSSRCSVYWCVSQWSGECMGIESVWASSVHGHRVCVAIECACASSEHRHQDYVQRFHCRKALPVP